MSEAVNSASAAFVLHSCEHCDYKTPKIAILRKHQRKYHELMPAKELNWRKCKRCHAVFSTRTEFADHKGCQIPCPTHGCTYLAPQWGKLVLHLNTIHTKSKTPSMKGASVAEREARFRAGKEAALQRQLQLRRHSAQELAVGTSGMFGGVHRKEVEPVLCKNDGAHCLLPTANDGAVYFNLQG